MLIREPNTVHIQLAPDARDNGLATMLAALVTQNLEAKPHKKGDFSALAGRVSIVAEDADVALTLHFQRGSLTIHDGIHGIPNVTIRGSAEVIMALSNMPLATRFGLPIARKSDTEGAKVVRAVFSAVRAGELHMYGAALHPLLVMRLTRVMSIHG
jgi:hypothetical protein